VELLTSLAGVELFEAGDELFEATVVFAGAEPVLDAICAWMEAICSFNDSTVSTGATADVVAFTLVVVGEVTAGATSVVAVTGLGFFTTVVSTAGMAPGTEGIDGNAETEGTVDAILGFERGLAPGMAADPGIAGMVNPVFVGKAGGAANADAPGAGGIAAQGEAGATLAGAT